MVWITLFLACNGDKQEVVDPVYFDVDGDGFTSDEDCNDNDASIYPLADETCDGIDNDCDSEIDEDPIDPSTWYADSDGDGFGDASISEEACAASSGYVADSKDCDDSNAAVYPGSNSEEGELCVLDADGDGFGDSSAGAPYDAGTDCDDANAENNPSSLERCDSVDNDCDGLIDAEDDNLDETHAATFMWYVDADGDFFGDSQNFFYACGSSNTGTDFAGDCDDSNPLINPDAEEVCDEIDNNCDSLIDDAEDPTLECDACTEVELTDTTGTVFAETALVGDDQTPSCATGSDDVVLRWTAPASGEYTFSSAADSIALWEECGVSELACETGASTTVTVTEGDRLNVVLEGSSGDLTVLAPEEYVCDDGSDDDADGYTDCDDDEDCWFNSSCGSAQCPNFYLVDPVTYSTLEGNMVLETTLSSSTDDTQASCFTAGGVDSSYEYFAEQSGCLQAFVYSDVMDVHVAAYPDCSGSELSCNNSSALATSLFSSTYGSMVAVDVTANTAVNLVVDGVPASAQDSFSMALFLNNVTDCDGNVLQ